MQPVGKVIVLLVFSYADLLVLEYNLKEKHYILLSSQNFTVFHLISVGMYVFFITYSLTPVKSLATN